jgi:hypothetical protein
LRYWTWAEIKAKVEADLGLEDEDMVSADEMLAYGNESIDEAEAEIHTINEDYFLTQGTVSLVSGTDSYDMPTDIYANKVRQIVYRNGSVVTVINRLKDSTKFGTYSQNLLVTANSGQYSWFPVNSTAGSPKILFTPPVLETGNYVTVWYLRNANRFIDDTSICDIPEFVSFVIQFIKVRCYEKEGHPNLGLAVTALDQQRTQMNATLTNMVPDDDTVITADLSYYIDHT